MAKAAFRRTWAAFPMRIDYHQQLMASIGFEREIARAVTCLAAGDEQGLLDAISDRMVDTYAIIGPAEECMRRGVRIRGPVRLVHSDAGHAGSAQTRPSGRYPASGPAVRGISYRRGLLVELRHRPRVHA